MKIGKQMLLLIVFLNCSMIDIFATRQIQLTEIADWIFKSDLIITARVNKVNKVHYETTTHKLNDGWYTECDNGREEYQLKVDTNFKGNLPGENLSVVTPSFCLHFSEKRNEGNKVSMRMVPHDNSWYRLSVSERNRIIILDYNNGNYEVLYSMPANEENLKFLKDVLEQGENYSFVKLIDEN